MLSFSRVYCPMRWHSMTCSEEGEYLDLLEKLPKDNQFLEDSDPNKFIAKMGAEAIYDLLSRLDLDSLSYELRNRAATMLHSNVRPRL